MAEPTDQQSKVTGSGSVDIKSKPKTEVSANSDSYTIEQLEPTATVIAALDRIGPDKPTNATAFTQAILSGSRHMSEYAGGLFTSVQLEDTDETRSAQAWLDSVQTLFDPRRIQEHNHLPKLHGRLVIIGLALLDGKLYQQLERKGAFTALVKELQPPLGNLADILSDRGRDVYSRLGPTPEVSDTVPNWPDDPLQRPEQDLLGRAAFARFVAKRIAAIPTDSGAYALHLYGAWGAGKSSVLSFLRAGLEQMGSRESSEEWLVVEFNAWRNQHIDPPWWSLMESVFQNTKGKLSWRNRMREYWWRLFSGRLVYVVSAVVLVWLLVLAIGWAQRSIIAPFTAQENPVYDVLNALAAAADDFGKIIALIVTVWGGIVGFNRSLLLGSAGAAKNYKDRIHNPMNEIKERFNTLVNRLSPRRVAVFIDDLDRCQSTYVVELLEGIQTLFREAPVVYVIAADRNWLNACYEQVYEKLEPHIRESGKSLGTLFLEKAFRFSTPMPGIPDELKRQYWEHLLQLEAEEKDIDWDKARSIARETASRAEGEGELQDLAHPSTSRSFVEQQAMREEVVVRLAHPSVIQRLEHTLKPYTKLLKPNPRAMKRLVNSYSASRALAILSAIDIESHQLALWTILATHWPQLAAYLEVSPEKVEEIGPDAEPKLPDIFRDDDVIRVVSGGGIGPRLSKETIENSARMHA